MPKSDAVDAALGHLQRARRAWQQGDAETARDWCWHARRVYCQADLEERSAVYRALREELEAELAREVRLARWLEVWPEQLLYLKGEVI